MKIDKKQNRILLGLTIAALIEIFFYQVAYATNESSYKLGFNNAMVEYHCYAHTSMKPGEDCGYIELAPSDACYTQNNPQMTNKTVCSDGFYNGFFISALLAVNA